MKSAALLPENRKALWPPAVVMGLACSAFLLRCSLAENIPANEWSAADARRLLAGQVEDEFCEKQLDGTGKKHFWTGDVASFVDFDLIPKEVARADANPLRRLPGGPVPFHGYYFMAVRRVLLENLPIRPGGAAGARADWSF